MGVRFPSVASTTIVNATLVTTAETVVVTTPPFNIPLDYAQIIVMAYAEVFPVGTTTTGIVAKLRRGTTTAGTQLGFNSGGTATPGAAWAWSMLYVDSPGVVAGQQYSVTLSQTAATANGTVLDVCLIAFAL